MQFDPRRFAGQFRMRREHFAVEQKRNVGVELLLHFMETQIGTVPRPILLHDEQDFVGLRVVREKIDHSRIGDAG